ncbi:MAG: FG-GAP-like repeat-containing protein, partial [Dysgonamonadaceae bacterium]|nr:FG-GAP-like repeat-containing protein [Dysgonamonadaceae bacterium]
MKLKGLTLTSARGSRRTVISGSQSSSFALKKCFFFLLLALSWGLHLQAQLPLKAKSLNVFVQPSQSNPDTIDVLSKSELSSCGLSGTTVQLVDAAGTLQHGSAGVYTIDKVITYTPIAGFTGQDSLKYRLICGAQIDTAIVLINVSDKPEVVKDDACAVDPVFQAWSITDTHTNAANLTPYQIPIVGDIDGDGRIEILCATNCTEGSKSFAMGNVDRPAESIAIYKGDNLTATPRIFNTQRPFKWAEFGKIGIVKTKINSQDTVLIVVAEADRILRAYNHMGDLVWAITQPYHLTDASNMPPIFADFNKDGIPEIAMGGKIFDSATGNLLCSTDQHSQAVIAVDLFNTGTLNYIAGRHIYDVDLSASSPADKIKLKRELTRPTITNSDPDYTGTSITMPASTITRALVADMNHDGKLEVITCLQMTTGTPQVPGDTCAFLCISDPETGAVLASKYVPKAGVIGNPFAGDIDGDGNVEVILIKNLQVGTAISRGYCQIIAYKYIPGNPVLQEFWRLDHTDTSGCTGLTLFDFDQDGKAEIVYRDENQLRIIDGTADGAIDNPTRNKAVFPNYSGTSLEYPVVADVDGDGQAEIVIVGGLNGTAAARTTAGVLWVFKSNDPNAPWAPARKVWNQYAYNPLWVNEDLTIPANPLSPATFFVDKDGNRHQPFNNFLQQATLLNDQGKMLSYGPKLEYKDETNDPPITYTGLSHNAFVTANFTVLNTGDADFKGPLHISAYFLEDGKLVYHGHTIHLGAGNEGDDGYIEKGGE